jgi:diadenosine tetraphosphate (Ap4A) HIT family hydrolase
MEVSLPGDHLVSTEDVVAFHLPPWPPPADDVYLGYLMVTPRRHTADFGELTDRESAAVGQWIARLSRSLKDLVLRE